MKTTAIVKKTFTALLVAALSTACNETSQTETTTGNASTSATGGQTEDESATTAPTGTTETTGDQTTSSTMGSPEPNSDPDHRKTTDSVR